MLRVSGVLEFLCANELCAFGAVSYQGAVKDLRFFCTLSLDGIEVRKKNSVPSDSFFPWKVCSWWYRRSDVFYVRGMMTFFFTFVRAYYEVNGDNGLCI